MNRSGRMHFHIPLGGHSTCYSSFLPEMSKYVHFNAPLGRSAEIHRQVRQAPGYITEYEASFVWPRTIGFDRSVRPVNSDTLPAGVNWDQILRVCNAFIDHGFEADRFASLREKIETRQLDASLEQALTRAQHLVREQVVLRDNAILHGDNSRINRAMLSEEMFELFLQFIDSVNEVKNA